MATITIRNLDERVIRQLKVQAALNGRSMEAEARALLTSEMERDFVGPLAQEGLGTAIQKLFAPVWAEEDSILVDEARRRYTPEHVKVLLVAEAPPQADSRRFFYFPNVQTRDSLVVETMKVLYPDCCGFDENAGGWKPGFSPTGLRKEKGRYLRMFQESGWYLEDAVDTSMPDGAGPAQKKKIIRDSLPALKRKLLNLIPNRKTPIILIGVPVFAECAQALREAGFTVLNSESIDTPVFGRAKYFRKKLRQLLEEHGMKSSDSA